MKRKNLETFLYSVGGIVAMFLILLGAYVIASAGAKRFDLTEENLYTLSDGTRAILQKLDTPVEIRFYVTQGKDMPVELKTYAQRVEDLLNEYKKAARGNLEIKKFDPQPDSDAEDSANLDGIEGQQINFGDKIYIGMAISMLESKANLPVLDPRRERLLEYDITRAIANVMNNEKAVVGVMSALPVHGEFNPMMMRMGQGKQEPWVFVNELKRDFTVKEVQMTAEKIDDDIKILVVVHPKGITDKTLYAIDQFLLRGGKLLAFVDPLSVVDSRSNPSQNPLQAAASGGSSLDKLTKAWGIEYDVNKVAADMVFVTGINRGQRAEQAPAVLSITGEGVNTNEVITSQIDNLLLPFAGVFSGTPAEGLTNTVLLQTTSNSQLIEKFMAEFSGEQVVKDFAPSGKQHALAIRLTGKFKTAFPDGKPKDTAPKPEGEKKEETPDTTPSLKESSTPSVAILVGDSDLLYDQFAAQVQEIFGQRLVFPRNGNLNLIQNMVEQLGGDVNLIRVRSRATMNRPFTLVRKMQADANERYRSKIKELEQSLSEAQTRLNELQRTKQEAGQRFILSPEQQAEIQKFQQKQAEVKKELKEVRKSLRREIDSLENRLKWVNIAGMPFLVALSGVSLAMIKRKRTAAK